jgi:eukaryotic-like serine/threonine-protein kinase
MVDAVAKAGRFPQLAKYELLEQIGHGGMATVYRARDRRLGREVAVKVIHPHLRDSLEVASRFQTEAKAVAKLHHPNIVEVYDVSEANEPEQYLVAELVRGTTLRKLQQQRGAMPPEIAAAIALEVLAALAHANASGVVHRDIKPENVLIEHRALPPDSAGLGNDADVRVTVKLTDFGIAKLVDVPGVTSTGQVLGSPAHMAPEQIEGGAVDARSDVFGVGVLLYECMVGHLPFEGTNPAQVLRRVLEGQYPSALRERPLIGVRWSALVDRALAHAPDDRFQDANAMRAAILAEFERLGFGSSQREVEVWLDGPAEYEADFAKRVVEQLCVRGDEARKRGDAVSAASDYNRALAQAPDDSRLLRLVAGMHRAQLRARLARFVAFALGSLAAAGAVSVAVGRLVHMRQASEPRLSGGASDMTGSVATMAREAELSPLPIVALPNPLPADAQATAPLPRARPVLPAKLTERTIVLDLKPPMGVQVSIDGKALRDVSTGDALGVDTGAHTLTFSCPVCTPVQVALAAGDGSDRFPVTVPIKPATLEIDGAVDGTYQILQHPDLSVHAGTNTINLSNRTFEHITVIKVETGKPVKVDLQAGKTTRATFD